MILAVVIFVVGILALVSTTGVVLRQMSGGAQQGLAATAVVNRLEKANASGCGALASGTATTAQITESWGVSDSGRVKYITDTVKYTIAGRRRSQTITGVVLCR
jgi:Tfp pilus assembly protein PilV